MPEGSEAPPQITENKALKKEIPRRSFLKGLAALAGLAAMKSVEQTPAAKAAEALAQVVQPQEKQASVQPTPTETKEKQLFSPRVTAVDALPPEPRPGIIKTKTVNNEELIKQILGNKYISREQLKQEFGEAYKEKWGQVYDKYPQQALMYDLFDKYFSHGERVADAMEAVWNKMGLKSTGIEVEPLQEVMDASKISYKTDAIGNPSTTINFSGKRLEQMLGGNKNRVINCSFEIGDVTLSAKSKKRVVPNAEISHEETDEGIFLIPKGHGMYFMSKPGVLIYQEDGKDTEITPISKEEFEVLQKQKNEEAEKNARIELYDKPEISITGAYDESRVEQNIPDVFELARKYPEKLFVFSAGNNRENLLKIPSSIMEQRPSNILIVGCLYEGEADGMKGDTIADVLGADFYVANKSLGLDFGSTFSAAAVSAVAEVLFQKGLSMAEVKEKIILSSRDYEYVKSIDTSDKIKTSVFDSDSLKKLLDES
jgi:hypothetical protein